MSGRAAPAGPLARLLLADSDPSLRTVLHLALQAHGYTEPDPRAALDAGANDALTKPFGIGQLLERLERFQALQAPAHSSPGHDKEHVTGAGPPWMRS